MMDEDVAAARQAEPARFVHDGDLRRRFCGALKGAGLDFKRQQAKPIVFHDLRHSVGTLAVRAFPLSDVKAFMGHSDISTTMLCVHHVPRHDAADALSRLVQDGALGAMPGVVAPSAV